MLVSHGSHCEVWLSSCPMSAAHLASGAGASCFTEGIRGKGPEQPAPYPRCCPVSGESIISWGESGSMGPADSCTLCGCPDGHTQVPGWDKVQPAGLSPPPRVCDCPRQGERPTGEAGTPAGLSGVRVPQGRLRSVQTQAQYPVSPGGRSGFTQTHQLGSGLGAWPRVGVASAGRGRACFPA